MKLIIAEMRPDTVPGYERLNIPIAVFSTHPRFVEDTRLDWGFVQIALRDGYEVQIRPLVKP